MLPDRLSGDLCSLHEGVPRACIALRMQINADGEKTGHTFHRGLMRSAASLTYEAVQQALDGQPDDKCAPLLEDVLKPRGVGVVIDAVPPCMTTRGVHKRGVSMVTSQMLGDFREDARTRAEFLRFVDARRG